ncbi:MAG: hypothetical protein LC667_11790, partial [Thioalkalivibrio sp.]|nr:hypothetical protein [Thioalkalivibrio sp.]
LRRAREAVLHAFKQMAAERTKYLGALRERLEARLRRLELERDRQEAISCKRELQGLQRRRELHRDALRTHAGWATELSQAWPGGKVASDVTRRVASVDIDRPADHDPVYEPFGAVDLEGWPRGSVSIGGREDELRSPECVGLGRLILEPCRPSAKAQEA